MRTGSSRSILSVILVVCAAAAVTAGTEALASGQNQPRRPTSLAVFTQTGSTTQARLAAFAPPGAVLAAVVGNTEVFADQNASGEDCVIYLTAGEGGASGCDAAAHVEQYGEVLMGTGKVTATGAMTHVRIAALLPNGVTSLAITDRDGARYTVAVKNNAVEHEDAHVASVTYKLPNGSAQTTNVASILDRIPREPGKPGTSG